MDMISTGINERRVLASSAPEEEESAELLVEVELETLGLTTGSPENR
jgi:hypothetical protein